MPTERSSGEGWKAEGCSAPGLAGSTNPIRMPKCLSGLSLDMSFVFSKCSIVQLHFGGCSLVSDRLIAWLLLFLIVKSWSSCLKSDLELKSVRRWDMNLDCMTFFLNKLAFTQIQVHFLHVCSTFHAYVSNLPSCHPPVIYLSVCIYTIYIYI